MLRLAGVGASPGIAMGVAHFLGGRVEVQERRIFTDEVANDYAASKMPSAAVMRS